MGEVRTAVRALIPQFLQTAGKVAGVLSVLGILGTVAGIIYDNLWLLGVGLGTTGLVFAVNRQIEIDRIQASRSRVRFVYMGSHDVNIRVSQILYEKASGKKLDAQERYFANDWVKFWFVEVSNDPPGHPRDAAVTDALPEITVFEYGKDDEPLVERTGRWTGNPQLIDQPIGANQDAVRRRDLPPNGERHRIDVLLKNPEEEGFYVASNEIWTQLGADPNVKPALQDSKAYLKPRKYRVSVRVIGTGMDPEIRWFKFDGTSDPPTWESESLSQ